MATRQLRTSWLNRINWSNYKTRIPQHVGHAQSLTHAESHSLMRAYQKLGSLPNSIVMYVDRKTCNICRGELPALLNALGVAELIIYSGGSEVPIIIHP